jgi:hypothetical protein
LRRAIAGVAKESFGRPTGTCRRKRHETPIGADRRRPIRTGKFRTVRADRNSGERGSAAGRRIRAQTGAFDENLRVRRFSRNATERLRNRERDVSAGGGNRRAGGLRASEFGFLPCYRRDRLRDARRRGGRPRARVSHIQNIGGGVRYRSQVRRRRREGDKSTVGADGRRTAWGLKSFFIHAHGNESSGRCARRRCVSPGAKVANVDIRYRRIGSSRLRVGNEICRGRNKYNEPAIGADGNLGLGGRVRGAAIRSKIYGDCKRRAAGGANASVPEEDVAGGALRHKVRCRGIERHKPPVGADCRRAALAIRGAAKLADRYDFGKLRGAAQCSGGF